MLVTLQTELPKFKTPRKSHIFVFSGEWQFEIQFEAAKPNATGPNMCIYKNMFLIVPHIYNMYNIFICVC